MANPIIRFLVFFLCFSLFPFSVDAALRDKDRWDHKYGSDTFLFGKAPIPCLKDHLSLLPMGKVLDLAILFSLLLHS